MRRPQNFAKSPPYFGPMQCQSKVRWRFCKILWPSQNVWTSNWNFEKDLAIFEQTPFFNLVPIPNRYVSLAQAKSPPTFRDYISPHKNFPHCLAHMISIHSEVEVFIVISVVCLIWGSGSYLCFNKKRHTTQHEFSAKNTSHLVSLTDIYY